MSTVNTCVGGKWFLIYYRALPLALACWRVPTESGLTERDSPQDSHVTESAPGDEGERTVGDRAVEHIDILLLLTLSKGMGAANREAVQEVHHFC